MLLSYFQNVRALFALLKKSRLLKQHTIYMGVELIMVK